MNDELLRVFVYGTLKPGEENYPRYCQDAVVEAVEAIAFGTLYSLPMGYPAMTRGTSPVYGYLLTFADFSVLEELDWLEDYDPTRPPDANEYHRDEIEVFSPDQRSLGLAWVYRMSTVQATQMGGTVLVEGNWQPHLMDTTEQSGVA